MVGSAIVRRLNSLGFSNIITADRDALDLLDAENVEQFFRTQKVDAVYLAAAKVGGIHANSTFPTEFLLENLQVQNNVISSAYRHNVERLLFLGSSCIYPRDAAQPIKEEYLLTGKLEPTNEPYAIAKIAGMKLCEAYNRQYKTDFRSVMPTNLYGPNDNFHPENSHVLPGLMRRLHEASVSGKKDVTIWGSGEPRREFMHVDDMADACVFVLNLPRCDYNSMTSSNLSHVNVGTGVDCTIKELATLIAKTVGFNGELVFDRSKPDGTPKKQLDVALLESLGWSGSISLEDGLQDTYQWFLENSGALRSS